MVCETRRVPNRLRAGRREAASPGCKGRSPQRRIPTSLGDVADGFPVRRQTRGSYLMFPGQVAAPSRVVRLGIGSRARLDLNGAFDPL